MPGFQMEQAMDDTGNKEGKTPSIWKVLGSVMASMFGVQSSRKHKEDFTHGKPTHYIVVGLGFTVLFVLTVWGVVKLVLYLSGI
jgi:hypothetical protein